MKKPVNSHTLLAALRKVQDRRNKRRSRGIGTSPVAIEPPGDAIETTVTWHSYGTDGYSSDAARPEPREGHLLWIDICGMRDHARIAEIAGSCGLSDLAIADLFHLDQRAHTDTDADLVLTVLRMPVAGPPFR